MVLVFGFFLLLFFQVFFRDFLGFFLASFSLFVFSFYASASSLMRRSSNSKLLVSGTLAALVVRVAGSGARRSRGFLGDRNAADRKFGGGSR